MRRTFSASLIVLAAILQQQLSMSPVSSETHTLPVASEDNQQVALSSKQPLVQQQTNETIANNNNNTTTTTTTTKQHGGSSQNEPERSCPVSCSSSEYLNILNKISLNVDIVRHFQRNEPSASANASKQNAEGSKQASPLIRPECVSQLIQMIKNLASGELEMKTLLEFASSTSQTVNLRSDLSYLRTSYANDKGRDLERLRQLQREQLSGCSQQQQQQQAEQEYHLLGDEPSLQAAELDKAHFLPKLVASIDQWLDTIERFTATREWVSLMRVFNGAESILNMFAGGANSSKPNTASVTPNNNSKLPKVQSANIHKAPAISSELLKTLERDLPGQAQTLTASLNQLFPWHVWPWNNMDLYSTIDTFLNHGIFAFSKTTAGPERRIDYLPQMLEALFKSLKYDSFPKKCNEWSRIICNLELFHERLVLAPANADSAETSNSTTQDELAKRKLQVRELTGENKNKLTQELVCIMFSSLSMQQFGANDLDLKAFDQPAAAMGEIGTGGQREQTPGAAPSQGLKWDRQMRKGLKLYKLSREALTDEQWAALYKQLNELWNQMKISDRVIMVGRIVQLLTNCHMPKEILESALWKDIYKYKNALNQISDIVIEELNKSAENGRFTIGQLAIGSKHLEDILTRFVRLLPRLIESLSQTLTDQLPELMSKFFDEKIAFFKGPCKGHSFSKLVPSLSKHRIELVELERLVCQQLRTKPSITMSQINNLTNEFLAMAFNLTNFGGSFQSLPRFWTSQSGEQTAMRQLGVSPQVATATGAAIVAATRQNLNILMANLNQTQAANADTALPLLAAARSDDDDNNNNNNNNEEESSKQANETSIIDELAANPRLAQIVAILQSSALDPPEVHAELPELDWVEAGTSVALLYETIQKLLSYEGLFVVFPEVDKFQDEMRLKLDSSKRMFTKFGKKDPVNLVVYSLDTLMPVALRTFQPLDSFYSECFSTFRDIFGQTDSVDATLAASITKEAGSLLRQQQGQAGGAGQPQAPTSSAVAASKESRQWQCAVSATNFASYALNNLIATFNSMLKNILNQMSRQRDMYKFKQAPPAIQPTGNSSASNATCVLFDGSITTLMDNLPQLVDLGLETILIASTSTSERLSLKDTMCSFENTLDPLGEHQYLQKQFRLREAVCHLVHESSLATCSEALRVDLWTSTMKELNSTWFEMSAISVEPSFRSILRGVHEFLDLFGKVKPSSMSDGLIARVLNFNSYWTGLMNKAVSSVEKYREKRFQLALQILMPIIYDNLPLYNDNTHSTMEETKLALKTSILSARSMLSYLTRLDNESGAANSSAVQLQDQIDQQWRALSDWTDRNSIAIGETLIRTVANNFTKFEQLFNSTVRGNNLANETWTRFCSAPVDAFLELELVPADNKAGLSARVLALELESAKKEICGFQWSLLRDRLFQQANLSTAIARSSTATQNASSTSIDQYSTRQLIRVSLTKWGQLLDLVAATGSGSEPTSRKPSRLPKFISLAHWQPLQEKLPALTPSQYDPTNFIWIWRALERLFHTIDNANRHHYKLVSTEATLSSTNLTEASNETSANVPSSSAEALARIFDQLNCALDVVKGGITWDNMVNIYQDRQDVLAAHATLNNGIALASASANTFLAHKKFQKFLNQFVKPRMGLSSFCDMRDKARLESIFSSSSKSGADQADDENLSSALESFQEFVCDTHLETFVQNINPISICYHQPQAAAQPAPKIGANSTTVAPMQVQQQPTTPQLAETIDRFFKLASLAILDAKLVDTNDAKPPIFEKSQWTQLRLWWLNQTEAHQGNSGLALALVRAFQTLDSINSEHVVWRAIFRSVHELSEVAAYLVRAAEMERQASLEQHERGQPTKLALIREAAEQVDSVMKDSKNSSQLGGLKFGQKLHQQQQQLASTMANVMFPEVSNFISLKTFKQLRYIKSISEYFAASPGAQQSLCRSLTAKEARSPSTSGGLANSTSDEAAFHDDPQQAEGSKQRSKFELIDYKLNTSERLYSLLCHYHSSQWLTAMNIVLSSKTSSLPKKVNYMTKYLLIFTKNFQHNENLQSFIHGQQLENIEAVANTTVSYLIALTQPFRTLTLSKISNISWHSIPSLLESIDRHLCVSKSQQQQQQQQQQHQPQAADGKSANQATISQQHELAVYEPKKPDIETLICKLPSWNITQVYSYISENIDLQNMISLAMQNNRTAALFGLTIGTGGAVNATSLNNQTLEGPLSRQAKTCITPFKFASKWLKIAQDLIDETMSKSSRDKIRKCLNSNKKSQSIYVQTTRYVKIFNSLLSTINDLTINNAWPAVRKTWTSISYAILSQTDQAGSLLPAAPGPGPAPGLVTMLAPVPTPEPSHQYSRVTSNVPSF